MIQHHKMNSPEYEHPFIGVSGPLGIGKTTTARLIADNFGYHLLEEQPERNPFVALATKDPARWAFASEVKFLMLGYDQNKEAQEIRKGSGVVDDVPIMQDVYSYGRAKLKGDQWRTFHNLYQSLEPQFMKPSLIVCLQARTGEIMRRIRDRDRDYEQKIKPINIMYLTLLNYLWIWKSRIPTVYIQTDHLDVVHHENAKKRMMDMIQKRL